MGLLDEAVTELRSVLAKLQDLDFWPPWDAAQTLVNLVADAVRIMTTEPAPSPTDVTNAATAWRTIAREADQAVADLDKVDDAVPPSVFGGEAGNALRLSTSRLSTRTGTVGVGARGVEKALTTLATEMTAARQRHRDADDDLRELLTFSWSDLNPLDLLDKVRGFAGAVHRAITEAIGAYQDASDAVSVADRAIRAAMDEIDLPDHLPTGVSAVSVVNAWDDDSGPLEGSVLARYDAAFGKLSAADQQAVRDALAGAGSDAELAWILAAVAGGLAGPALANYLTRLHGMSPAEIRALDPSRASGDDYRQPDDTTCGSTSLVMARMYNDPAYAMWIQTGYNPHTGETDPRTVAERVAAEAQLMHVRTNLPLDRTGMPQLPWPPQIGTHPWAVANEMSAEGGSGVPGTEYDVRIGDPHQPGRMYDDIVRATEDGHAVPLYVGNDQLARHVVLVTGSDGEHLSIYDPARGDRVTVSRDDFEHSNLNVSGWDEPWFAVTPR